MKRTFFSFYFVFSPWIHYFDVFWDRRLFASILNESHEEKFQNNSIDFVSKEVQWYRMTRIGWCWTMKGWSFRQETNKNGRHHRIIRNFNLKNVLDQRRQIRFSKLTAQGRAKEKSVIATRRRSHSTHLKGKDALRHKRNPAKATAIFGCQLSNKDIHNFFSNVLQWSKSGTFKRSRRSMRRMRIGQVK